MGDLSISSLFFFRSINSSESASNFIIPKRTSISDQHRPNSFENGYDHSLLSGLLS